MSNGSSVGGTAGAARTSAAGPVPARHGGPAFAATRWSIVLAAGGGGGTDGQISTTRSRRALAELFRTYWFPLYAFVRRRGYEHAAAEDLVQEFFARLLESQLARHKPAISTTAPRERRSAARSCRAPRSHLESCAEIPGGVLASPRPSRYHTMAL